MKTLKILSVAILTALIGLTGLTFAQDEPVKTQDRNQIQTEEQVQTQVQSQVMNQNMLHGNQFVDENGDGFNDNAPDTDGDGIPNGRDEDFTGPQNRKGNSSKGFVDLNGDGINDNAIDSDGDGIPNGQDDDYIRPQDGSGSQFMKGMNNRNKAGGRGFEAGSQSGNCDGAGPKGKRNR
ncbi:MAG: hypothetical protein Kow0098_07080 [Ignavibacteriaceae bacterium]